LGWPCSAVRGCGAQKVACGGTSRGASTTEKVESWEAAAKAGTGADLEILLALQDRCQGATHSQCSICNKCIRPFDLVERCASHQTIFHHRCTIDPSPPLSVLHCLNTCARHIVQFRQPRQLVGPDGRSDLRGCGGDDESMNVTEEENLFQSSYEESEDLANSVADSAGESPPADLCVHCSCRSPSDCRHAQAERDAADACPETQAYLDQRWSEERRADELAQDEDEIPPTPPMTAMQRDDR